jgi:spore coat polysaccharide biosynthesis protein SpsF
MSDTAAIVLQARMGSNRLPGKSLAPIAGRTVLARCVERLRARSGLMVVLATTTNAEDDVLVTEAARLGLPVVRGPVDDVLERYVLAATTFGLTEVIRATADNPVVDLDAPRRTLALLRRTRAGYIVERGLPYGAAVEAISVPALKYAAVLATEPYDREHVTPILRRDRRFVSLDALVPAGVRRPELRFTVDTPEDLEYVRQLYDLIEPGEGPAPLTAFIDAADDLRDASGGESGAGAR